MASAYFDVLDEHELEEAARQAASAHNIFGGCTDEEAREHFAVRFPNSAIRSIAAYVDPSDKFTRASSLLRRLLSNGNVVILDLPSGTGAASLGLLLAAACLREAGCVPSVPASIEVLAADCSNYSLLLMRDMLGRVDPYLRRNGLYCNLTLLPWNAENSHETSLLFDHAYAIGSDHYLVVTADFSGAAGGPGFTNYRDSFVTIRDRVHNKRNAYWIHIEPARFTKAQKLFSSLNELTAKLFGGIGAEGSLIEECEFPWRAPFTGLVVPVRVQIWVWRGEEYVAA